VILLVRYRECYWSDLRRIESDENGCKIDAEGIGGDGNPTHVEYSAKFDGKDYTITGAPGAEVVSVKRIDSNTMESTMACDGGIRRPPIRRLIRAGEEERFLSAQADPFAGAKGEEKVGLLRSK
jgi:hypothetical protein